MRILKRHVGRPVDFTLCGDREGVVVNGHILRVRNRIAVIEHPIPRLDGIGFLPETYTTYLPTNSDRIVGVY